MIRGAAEELANPETVAAIAALTTATRDNPNRVEIHVIVTQYPVAEQNRLTSDE